MTDKPTGTKVKGGIVRIRVEPGIGASFELANSCGETIIFIDMTPEELREHSIAVAKAVSQLHAPVDLPLRPTPLF